MSSSLQCWCGNKDLVAFSDDYARCTHCETLVLINPLKSEQLTVNQQDAGLYGREYWFEHQNQDLGLPDITKRSRTDFTDRIPYWLNTILKYKLPPATTLELGCSHGGLVSLMRKVGYDAIGLELSPSIVAFAQKTFDIPVLTGPLEEQSIEPASIDIIILMDVLEHLPEPITTLTACQKLLKPDGIIVIQTPCYPEGITRAEMEGQHNPFLGMLQAPEHIYLFSQRSVDQALKQCGFSNLAFEHAIFNAYDMFLVAGLHPFNTNLTPQIEAYLLSAPERRLVLTLLDLHADKRNLQSQMWKRWTDLDKVDAKDLGLFFYEHEDMPSADQAFRRAIAKNNNDIKAWMNLAILRYENHNFPEAIKFLLEAIRIEPLNAEAWAGMALSAIEVNDTNILISAYERLLVISPDHAVIGELSDDYQRVKHGPPAPPVQLTNEADLLTEQALKAYEKNDRKSAERLFLQALKNTPNHFNALVSLGKLYYERARFTDARSYLRSATAQRPDDADAWVGLAMAATKLNDRATFREAYQRALALDPAHPQLKNLSKWN